MIRIRKLIITLVLFILLISMLSSLTHGTLMAQANSGPVSAVTNGPFIANAAKYVVDDKLARTDNSQDDGYSMICCSFGLDNIQSHSFIGNKKASASKHIQNANAVSVTHVAQLDNIENISLNHQKIYFFDELSKLGSVIKIE